MTLILYNIKIKLY